jgi:hypothetical protein
MPVEVTYEGRIELTDDQARLVKSVQDLLDHGEAALGRVNANGEFQNAVALLIGQAVVTGRALHLLSIAGRSYQAFPTARAVLENVINAHYIARDPATRAQRFWIYRPIPHAKVAEARYRVFGISDELKEIRQQAQAASRLLASDKKWERVHWARGSIRERAKECGLESVYDLYYAEASAFSHGDASIFNALVKPDRRTLALGPSPAGIEAALAPAFSSLYVGLLLLARVFQDHDLERALGVAVSGFPDRIKRIDLSSHFNHLRARS